MKTKNLPASTILDHTTMCGHVYRSFALACADQAIYREGYFWWNNCQGDCIQAVDDLASSGIVTDLIKFAGMVSAVSPSRYWRKNIVDAIHGTFAWFYFTDSESRIAHILDCHVGIPYGTSGFVRGWQILDGTRTLSYAGSPKTYSMQDNTVYPDSSQEITIDQHIVHLMLADGMQGSISISKRQYALFANAIRECAAILGLLPCRLQAIIWTQRQYELRSR